MTYYTELIEHYLRTAVRFPSPFENQVVRKWQTATQIWLDSLSVEDQELLQRVFAYEFFTTRDGILSFPGNEANNWKRLNALERELAQYLNVI